MNAPIPVLSLADRPIVDIAREVARKGGVLVRVERKGVMVLCLKQRPERPQ